MSKSGFEFSGSGRIDRIDTFTTKAGKEIVTLVLQVEGTYPQLVPIKCFGRLAGEASEFSNGDLVEVTGRLGGRDWNGKVYPDIVAETVEVVGASPKDSAPKQQELPSPPGDDDIPF